jgi:hypothetical protein
MISMKMTCKMILMATETEVIIKGETTKSQIREKVSSGLKMMQLKI